MPRLNCLCQTRTIAFSVTLCWSVFLAIFGSSGVALVLHSGQQRYRQSMEFVETECEVISQFVVRDFCAEQTTSNDMECFRAAWIVMFTYS